MRRSRLSGIALGGKMTLPDDADTALIFIAGSPTELERAAIVLDEHQIDFATAPGAFIKPFLGGSVYEGIAFRVFSGQAAFAREQLLKAGLKRGVVALEESDLPAVREYPIA